MAMGSYRAFRLGKIRSCLITRAGIVFNFANIWILKTYYSTFSSFRAIKMGRATRLRTIQNTNHNKLLDNNHTKDTNSTYLVNIGN